MPVPPPDVPAFFATDKYYRLIVDSQPLLLVRMYVIF